MRTDSSKVLFIHEDLFSTTLPAWLEYILNRLTLMNFFYQVTEPTCYSRVRSFALKRRNGGKGLLTPRMRDADVDTAKNTARNTHPHLRQASLSLVLGWIPGHVPFFSCSVVLVRLFALLLACFARFIVALKRSERKGSYCT